MQKKLFSYFKPPPDPDGALKRISTTETKPEVECNRVLPAEGAQPPPVADPCAPIAAGEPIAPEPGPTRSQCEAAAPPTSLSEGDTEVSEYERRRLENMKRNADFLHQLGLHDVKKSVTKAAKVGPPTKRVKSEKPSAPVVLPTRRSTRNILPPQSYSGNLDVAPAAIDDDESTSDSSDGDDYDDSGVLKYAMSEAGRAVQEEQGETFGATEGSLRLQGSTSEEGHEELYSPDLAAVYSMHTHEKLPSLLLAAGKGGQVVLFRLPHQRGGDIPMSTHDCFGESDEAGDNVLMSFRAHNKWIGSARLLVSGSDGDSPTVHVATCADDGIVKVWDASLCRTSHGVGKSRKPRLACESREIHDKGIFCMDIFNDTTMLTGSKDKSVAITEIRISHPTVKVGHSSVQLRPLSRFDVHSGVVKTVAWQRPIYDTEAPRMFASGSIDNSVVIKDIRTNNNKADVIISGVYERGGVHTVQWSPEPEQSDHLLLTAGFGDSMKLFDIRKADSSTPLFVYTGHCRRNNNMKSNSVLQTPSFIPGKKCVATAGLGSDRISLYCTETGKCLSRGKINDEPNTVYAPLLGSCSRRVFVSCKRGYIYPFNICGDNASSLITTSTN